MLLLTDEIYQPQTLSSVNILLSGKKGSTLFNKLCILYAYSLQTNDFCPIQSCKGHIADMHATFFNSYN